MKPWKDLALDSCFLALVAGGAGAIAYGASLFHPGAGWIVAGAGAIALAWRALP